jgi:hypothetical protein
MSDTTHVGRYYLWVLLLGVLAVLGVIFLPRTPQDPSARAIADLRGCERRVGIPAPTDPAYQAVQHARYGAYGACMLNLGYTSTTLP